MEELEHLGLNLSYPYSTIWLKSAILRPKKVLIIVYSFPFLLPFLSVCANLTFNYKLWRAVRNYKNHTSVRMYAKRTFTLFLSQSVNQWKLLLYSALHDMHPKVNYSKREIICSFFILSLDWNDTAQHFDILYETSFILKIPFHITK